MKGFRLTLGVKNNFRTNEKCITCIKIVQRKLEAAENEKTNITCQNDVVKQDP